MPRINGYRHIKSYVDRHGAPRIYFRRVGALAQEVALPTPLGSPAFVAAYADAYAMAFPASGVVPRTTEIGAKRTRAGSVAAEIASYLASADFAKNEAVTQKDYRRFLEGIRHHFGDLPIATLARKHVVAMVDRMKDTPSEARNFLKVLSVVCKHAVNRGEQANQHRESPA